MKIKKRENNAFFLSFFGYLVYCVVACCGYSKQQTTYAHRGLTGPFLHILDDEFLMHCSNIVVTTTVVVCGLVLPLLWYFYGQKLFPLGYNEAYLTFTILERTSNSVRRDSLYVTFYYGPNGLLHSDSSLCIMVLHFENGPQWNISLKEVLL